jgi:hypothetical protein
LGKKVKRVLKEIKTYKNVLMKKINAKKQKNSFKA